MMAGAPGMSNLTSFTWVFQLPAWRLIAPEAAPASTLAAFSAAPASSVLPASSDLPQPASAKAAPSAATVAKRSEEHTSELQSLMRISYAVFCLKKKKQHPHKTHANTHYTSMYTHLST